MVNVFLIIKLLGSDDINKIIDKKRKDASLPFQFTVVRLPIALNQGLSFDFSSILISILARLTFKNYNFNL